ncbi:MAG TPA: ArsC/Spx/MgsR family protein [Woeseiaceae bacterium]|nr:ArsC/Spx/MgsR family protein [Woeseiaceae bacterium]
MTITIYHNPSCSKSRKTLELIRDRGIEPRIVEYLKTPPDAATILKIADLLQVPVANLVRQSGPSDPGGRSDAALDDNSAAAEWLAARPKLLQRPLVVDEDRNVAVIGRPPEAVLGLLADPAAESSAGS